MGFRIKETVGTTGNQRESEKSEATGKGKASAINCSKLFLFKTPTRREEAHYTSRLFVLKNLQNQVIIATTMSANRKHKSSLGQK